MKKRNTLQKSIILDALKDAITRAYEAADDKAKEFIRYPYELYQDWEIVLG